MLAKREENLKAMMRRFKRYIKRKGLRDAKSQKIKSYGVRKRKRRRRKERKKRMKMGKREN